MATCKTCLREMLDVNFSGCIPKKIRYGDTRTARALPYPETEDARCHDCNCAPGGFHHPGCDMEHCPRCGGQLISCDCP